MIERSTADWRAFVVGLDYTDAELDSLQRIMRARANRSAGGNWFWLVLCQSIAIGLIVVGIAISLGLADHDTAGILGVTVCACFWLGIYLPSLVQLRARRRREYRQFREDWRGISLLISPRGIVLRRPHLRSAYGRAAIETATSEAGLILLWISPRRPLAVPERLLTAEQRAWLIGLATA